MFSELGGSSPYIFVRYQIAGVWHRVDFVRASAARRFYAAVAAVVPRHASAVEYHDPALPHPIVRRAVGYHHA